MVKKILSMALIAMAGLFSLSAQQLTPMPENPKVKSGKLPNGMSYYILHNEEPKQRANFYIAQKVGSTLELPEQLGLAHFLEHMAFNGTKNYPGKAILNYLQSKGIRFGADINAYTSFDETVYNINNIPTTDQALMDSVLLVLHDWSCDLSLETEEINSERGVIQEEWRMRNDANTRMYTAMLPAIYDEYQYRQMPIGTMDVVMNFDPEVLRDYYHKWYRPDQQGIIVVGDFDAAEMEKKVIAMFSPIPMPENAPERTYPTVSDNKEPIYFEFSDPEMTNTIVRFVFKSEKMPFEQRNTVEGYIFNDVMPIVISTLFNNRLDEYSKDANCKYSYAGVRFDDFFVSKTKDAFYVTVLAKNDPKEAFEDAMKVVTRAAKTGFTESEVSRAKDELLALYEKAYNERDKTNSDNLAKELIRHFIDNQPAPGIEMEKQLIDQFSPMLAAPMINEMCKDLLTPENEVMVVTTPASTPLPGKDVMLATAQNVMGAEYEAYVDEVITDPLIPKYLKAGKVKSQTENKEFGYTEMTLSNGAKVVVKPTDYASDEILLTAFRQGGKQMYPASEAANTLLLSSAYDYSRLGSFDQKTLTKYLAGKNVSLSFEQGLYISTLNGKSTVKDLETLMDLVYATFTAVGNDQANYDNELSRIRPMLAQQEKNPMFHFGEQRNKSMYNNPAMEQPTLATLDAASYPKMLSMFQNLMSNAADFTFVFTGNIDAATLKPMLEKYIASLPSKKKPSKVTIENPINLQRGQINNDFKQSMQVPSTIIFDLYSGTNLPYTVANDVRVDAIGEILSMIFTETLREEEGGSYSPYAYSYFNPVNNMWQLIYVVQTNADVQQKMIDRAYAETVKLLKEGANAEKFNRVKEAALNQYDNKVRTNAYWDGSLVSLLRGYNTITGYREAIQNMTLEDFNAFMKTLWDGKDRIQVVMSGVPEAK